MDARGRDCWSTPWRADRSHRGVRRLRRRRRHQRGAAGALVPQPWARTCRSTCPTGSPRATARAPPPSAACASEGVELVVTVDCGAAAHDALHAAARDRPGGGRHRPSPDARRAAAGRRPGQSQPPGLRLGAGGAGRRRGDLRAARRAQPRGARRGACSRTGPSPTCAMARPRGAGRDLRRHPAGRLQPRPRGPGAEGDVGAGAIPAWRR